MYLSGDPGVRNFPHNAGDVRLIPAWGTKSHTPQLLNPHSTTGDVLEGPEEINSFLKSGEGRGNHHLNKLEKPE